MCLFFIIIYLECCFGLRFQDTGRHNDFQAPGTFSWTAIHGHMDAGKNTYSMTEKLYWTPARMLMGCSFICLSVDVYLMSCVGPVDLLSVPMKTDVLLLFSVIPSPDFLVFFWFV